jgi:hypothetical protein
MKSKKDLVLFFSLLFVIEACSPKGQNNIRNRADSTKKSIYHKFSNSRLKDTTIGSVEDTILENKILNKIFNLPEVQAKQKFIDSLTNHKSGVSAIIFKTPTQDSPYYWVQVGYNNSFRFEPYYNFYVYPQKGLEIKFLNTLNDSTMSLKEWRENK